MNFLFTLQNEAAGAVAFSSFDTLLAPFVYLINSPTKKLNNRFKNLSTI